jgi:putative phosphoribosyl transferase
LARAVWSSATERSCPLSKFPGNTSPPPSAANRPLIRRERAYRGDRPFPSLRGKTVILVDDGIAADSPVRAALRALQLKHPAAIVVATPIATDQMVQALRREVADVVTVLMPEHLLAVGEFYDHFQPPTDDEVRELLAPPDVQPADRPLSLR